MSQEIYFTVLVGAICVLINSVLLVTRGRESLHWPEAKGSVLESRLVSGADGPWYLFKYRYRVAEEDYISSTIGYFRSRAEKRAVIKTYPRGAAVPVRYRPATPEDGVVIVGAPKIATWIAGASITFTALWLGVGVILYLLR